MKKNSMRASVLAVIILALMAVSIVAADSNTVPTVSNEVCVALQPAGPRPSPAEGEPVIYEMRAAGGTTALIGPESTTTDVDGCFDVIGNPNVDYDIYIKGPDHLSVQADLGINFPPAPGGVTMDLSGTVTLLEGDANNDDCVRGSDASLLVTQFGGAGSADFNENGLVQGSDASLLVGNFDPSCTTRAANRSANLGDAEIRFDPAMLNVETGDKFDVQIIIDNPSAESIDSLQLDIEFLDELVAFDPFVPGDQFAFLLGGNCAFANTPVTCAFPSTDVQIGPTLGAGTADVFLASSNPEGGSTQPIVVGVLRLTALSDITSRSAVEVIKFTVGDAVDETGTLYYFQGSPIQYNNLTSATAVQLSEAGTSNSSTISVIGLLVVIALIGSTLVAYRSNRSY